MDMRVPSAARLLDVWECGLEQPLPRQMLMLLAEACPELTAEQLTQLPIGRRDARLLEVRERLFGPDVSAVASCPRCATRLESTFNLSDIRVNAADAHVALQATDIAGYRVTFRLPSTSDLLALEEAGEGTSPRYTLLDRCLVEIRAGNGDTLQTDALPEDVIAQIVLQMSVADPQADIELDLSCPACGESWRALFDIASFLAKELDAWAQRTLRDVHDLARAYGWREADVLALSPTRREAYLELARL